jgi:hypothetical protein
MTSGLESPLRLHLNARAESSDALIVGSRIAFFVVLVAMTLALLASGCAVGYSDTYPDDGYGPDLVYAGPGVQVIADYDEPIFFSDGFYWRSSGGYWYRSHDYHRGWVSARPPGAVLRIQHPQTYAHYRPAGWAPRGRPPAVRRDERGRYEAHGAPPPRPTYQAAPPPRAQPQGWRGAPAPAPRAQPQGWRAAPAQRGAPPAHAPRGGEHHDHH